MNCHMNVKTVIYCGLVDHELGTIQLPAQLPSCSTSSRYFVYHVVFVEVGIYQWLSVVKQHTLWASANQSPKINCKMATVFYKNKYQNCLWLCSLVSGLLYREVSRNWNLMVFHTSTKSRGHLPDCECPTYDLVVILLLSLLCATYNTAKYVLTRCSIILRIMLFSIYYSQDEDNQL